MLKVETGFKIKLTPQFQDWRDKNYFSPQNQYMLKKFSCLAVRNVNLENHMHFLPYWQFCHFSRTIYNQFQSTRKRNSFSSLLNFSRGKTSEIQNSEFDEISERSAISKFLWGPQNVQGAGSQRNN